MISNTISRVPPRRPPLKSKIPPALTAEYGKLLKLLDKVKTNEQAHIKQMNGSPSHRSETMFGSAMGPTALNRSQLRYHNIKWRAARRCVQRRVNRLSKYISSIEKKK